VSSPYRIDFDISTIKHLGLQMYATLPPVVGELVANAWDANATEVEITIPEAPIDEHRSEIVIKDNGIGMSDDDIREKYLIVGRDRRENEGTDQTPAPLSRPIMGRKGIGKFSAFGIAKELEIESASKGATSRFVMDYDEMLANAAHRHAEVDLGGRRSEIQHDVEPRVSRGGCLGKRPAYRFSVRTRKHKLGGG